MWRWIKRLYSFTATLVCVAVVGTLVWASNLCKLKDIEGKRAFYLYSASSQAKIVENLRFEHLFSVRGESVRFAVTKAERETVAENVLQKYGAELVFTEETDGVVCYYGITERFGQSVMVNGKPVNLHVAVSQTECVVGYPIIFGGF
ncbi:MAG: YwmB family TATA-box binding protein [Clostridia bacterium]|nr:YwmB family TATA-box binding protein [Clostridia bacterium]